MNLEQTVVGTPNRMMIGWPTTLAWVQSVKSTGAVEQHARIRLRQWLCAKHKVAGPATCRDGLVVFDLALHDCVKHYCNLVGSGGCGSRGPDFARRPSEQWCCS